MLKPNDLLHNRYLIVRQLGRGGMGTVYEAVDQQLSAVVAVKSARAETDELRRLFNDEAALLANLRHLSLPRVLYNFSEGREHYLVMDYVAGSDLEKLLSSRGAAFPVADVVKWGEHLLGVLEYLHGQNPPIVHRDIKPANIKLTGEGDLFLLDFGLAKGTAGMMQQPSVSRSVFGYTLYYAPLEQILGTGTDARSDLYSIGATLYHLCKSRVEI